MQFFSKNNNLQIVYRSGQTIMTPTGQLQNFPGQYIQFENGTFVTEDPEIIKFIMSNKKFGIDIFATETTSPRDPFAPTRHNSEPNRTLHFLDGGHIAKTVNTGKTPRQAYEEAVQASATRIATEMVKKMMGELQSAAKATVPASPQVNPSLTMMNQPANTAPVAKPIEFAAPVVIKSEKPLSFVVGDELDPEVADEIAHGLVPGLEPIKPLVALSDDEQMEGDYDFDEEATPENVVTPSPRKGPGRPSKKK